MTTPTLNSPIARRPRMVATSNSTGYCASVLDEIRQFLHLEADRAHQRKRVAVLDHAWPHSIVERHPAILEPILEVHVDSWDSQTWRQLGEGQVVRRHQADGAAARQRAYDRLGPDPPIVRICPVENLVEQ